MAILRLRSDVEYLLSTSEVLHLRDTRTGRSYQLPAEARALLESNDFRDEQVLELQQSLSSLGLMDEGLTQEAIELRQKQAHRSERARARWEDLQQTLELAYERVPFYRTRFQQLKLTPKDIQHPSELDLLPPTTKADLRKHFPHDMLSSEVSLPTLLQSPRYSIAATSGTTGDRLQVLFDHQAGHLPPFMREMWNIPANTPLDRGAIFTSPICAGFECHLEDREYAKRIRGSVLTLNTSDDFFRASKHVLKTIAEELERFAPNGMFLNTWYAVEWLRKATELNLPIPKLNVLLPAYQYPTKAHKRLISLGFSAPVFSNYGSTDLGGPQAGIECHHGNMHIREDNVWLDITREGKSVNNHELGDVSITTLANPYMPLIRYEVGDIGRRVDEECGCAIGETWRTFELHGRKADLLSNRAQLPVTTKQVDDALGEEGPTFYSLIQNPNGVYAFSFLDDRTRSEEPFIESLRTLLGADARIEAKAVTHFTPEPSLKYRQTGMRTAPKVRG